MPTRLQRPRPVAPAFRPHRAGRLSSAPARHQALRHVPPATAGQACPNGPVRHGNGAGQHPSRPDSHEALQTPLQSIIAALEGMKIRKDRQEIFRDGDFKKMMIISKKDPVLEYQSLIDEASNNTMKVVELPDGHMSHIENKKSFSYNIMHFIENI